MVGLTGAIQKGNVTTLAGGHASHSEASEAVKGVGRI